MALPLHRRRPDRPVGRPVALLLAVAASLTLALAACTRTTPRESEPNRLLLAETPPLYLNLNLGEEPASLDSAVAPDSLSLVVLNAVQEGLMRYGPDGRLQPALAERYQLSPDGRRYTFTLREAVWSDGRPITAHDFEYAWKRAIDPRTGSRYSYQLAYLEGAESAMGLDPVGQGDQIDAALEQVGVRAVDERTLEVTLAKPAPFWIGLTSFVTYLPQRRDVVERYGERFAKEADTQVYSGPFVVAEWEHGSHLVLKKNERYWDAASVRLGTVRFEMVKDLATPIHQFDAGQLDATTVTGEYVDRYRGKGLQTVAEASTVYLQFNVNGRPDSPFRNADIRRALSRAFDRRRFADGVLRDGSLPATALTPPSIHDQEGRSFVERWLAGQPGFPVRSDAEGARELLARGLREVGLARLPRVTLLATDSDRSRRETQAIAANLREHLGIDVGIVNVDFKTYVDRLNRGQFDVAYVSWGADYDDPNTFLEVFVGGGGFNAGKWRNEEYDRLYRRALASGDNTERMRAFARIEQILAEEVPIAPLFWPVRNFVQQPWVKGIVRRPVGAGVELKWAYTEGRPGR